MTTTLTANFETRRDAEMTVERLVQEIGVDRDAIVVAAAGNENTAGEEIAGSDTEAGEPSPERRDDAALNGQVTVSVDVEDDGKARDIRQAFSEFGGEDGAAS